MNRLRGARLLLLAGLLVFAHPVVADGPGPDPVYTYESFDVDPADTRTVQAVVELDRRGAVLDGTAADAVREAQSETYETPVDAAPDGLAALRGDSYVAVANEHEFYVVTTRVQGETLALDATAVSADRLLGELSVSAAAAPDTVQRTVAAGSLTAEVDHEPQVVETGTGYVLVRQTDRDLAADPAFVPKVGLYAVGGALLVGGLAFYPRADESDLLLDP